MKTTNNQLDKIGNRNPFQVPENYFEELTSQIMTQLPKKVVDKPHVSVWDKVKPWAYMAAMFVGIALMVKVFVKAPEQSNSGLNISSAEVDDFYEYYENQLAKNMYHEAIYLVDTDNYNFE